MSIGSRGNVDGRQKTTASAEAPGGHLPPSGLEVTDLAWERIQLHLTIGAVDDAPRSVDGELHLRPLDRSGTTLASRPPTRAVPAGRRAGRFNVFCDEAQMPLEPGRWELVLRRPGGDPAWSSVPLASVTESPVEARTFPWYEVTYGVTPMASAGDRGLILDISVDRPASLRRWIAPRAVLQRLADIRRRVWVGLFGGLVRLLGRWPKRSPLIVFTSDSRVDLGGNLKLVHDRFRERRLDAEWRVRTIFKPSIRMRRTLADRARLVWLMAQADVILLEDYQPAIYRLPQRPERQRIIQLWHAWGAFKTVGYSRIGKPGGPNPWSRVHKNYTFATVSSRHEEPFYAEAFGVPDERVVGTGTPRMDDFLDPDKQRARREAAYEAVPPARGREVILFAPTFRGRSARGAEYPVELIDVAALHRLCVERDAVAIVRMHPFVDERIEVPEGMRDRILEASDLRVETNDLLLITDVLVTDYSSLVFEFSSLRRPMLFFAFDLEEYVASRDFYEPFETFVPGRIVRTFDELLDAIRSRDYQQDKVEPFARRHLPDEAGSATDRIIDDLVLGGWGEAHAR